MPRARLLIVLSITMMNIGAAVADEHRPAIDWSTWIRIAGRSGDSRPLPDGSPRMLMPTPTPARSWSDWEGALGAELSLDVGAHGDRRLGVWAEATTTTHPVIGVEILLGAAPRRLDLFQYEGEGLVVVRGGASQDVMTAAIAYGYRAPWKLWGPWPGATKYEIGVRFVVTATRARADRDDWWVTAGIELEPIGSVRYLFGVKDWY